MTGCNGYDYNMYIYYIDGSFVVLVEWKTIEVKPDHNLREKFFLVRFYQTVTLIGAFAPMICDKTEE
jgi:hypothetical protein